MSRLAPDVRLRGALDGDAAVGQIHTVARNAAKLAISLDRQLLSQAERLRQSTGETRSALMARALRELLRSAERARLSAEYVDAYRRVPETPAVIRTARALARRTLAELDWDDT